MSLPRLPQGERAGLPGEVVCLAAVGRSAFIEIAACCCAPVSGRRNDGSFGEAVRPEPAQVSQSRSSK